MHNEPPALLPTTKPQYNHLKKLQLRHNHQMSQWFTSPYDHWSSQILHNPISLNSLHTPNRKTKNSHSRPRPAALYFGHPIFQRPPDKNQSHNTKVADVKHLPHQTGTSNVNTKSSRKKQTPVPSKNPENRAIKPHDPMLPASQNTRYRRQGSKSHSPKDEDPKTKIKPPNWVDHRQSPTPTTRHSKIPTPAEKINGPSVISRFFFKYIFQKF